MRPVAVATCVLANIALGVASMNAGYGGISGMVFGVPFVILAFCAVIKRHYFQIALLSWATFWLTLFSPLVIRGGLNTSAKDFPQTLYWLGVHLFWCLFALALPMWLDETARHRVCAALNQGRPRQRESGEA